MIKNKKKLVSAKKKKTNDEQKVQEVLNFGMRCTYVNAPTRRISTD